MMQTWVIRVVWENLKVLFKQVFKVFLTCSSAKVRLRKYTHLSVSSVPFALKVIIVNFSFCDIKHVIYF